MIKRKVVLILAVIILFVATSMTAFALYIASTNVTIDFNVNEKGETLISTERELILATTDILNRTDDSSNRLKIESNITLTKDLNITREVTFTEGSKDNIITSDGKFKVLYDTVTSYLNESVKDFYIDSFDYIYKVRHHDISWGKPVEVIPGQTEYTVTATYGMDTVENKPFIFKKDITIVTTLSGTDEEKAAAEEQIRAQGKKEIDNFLSPYIISTNATTTKNSYFLRKNLSLPVGNTYLGLSYSYEIEEVYAESVAVSTGVELSGNYLKVVGEGSFILKATITRGEAVANSLIDYEFSVVTSTNEQIVNLIMESTDVNLKWLFFYDIYSSADPQSLKGLIELPLTNAFVDKGIVSADYKLVGDNKVTEGEDIGKPKFVIELNQDSIYEIRMLRFPSAKDNIYLEIVFTFLDKSIATRQSKLYYIDAGEGGGAGSGAFEAHLFNTLDLLLMERSGGHTYTSFVMPSELLGKQIEYKLVEQTGSTIDVETEIITQERVGEFVTFKIDRTKIPHNDVKIKVTYSFGGAEYTNYSSSFTLIGLVNKSDFTTGGIFNENLYNKVLKVYDTSSTLLGVTTPTTGEGVLTYREAIAVNSNIFSLENISLTSLKGIEILLGTSRINLNNTGITTGANYLAQLRLKELHMAGNGLGADFLIELQTYMFNYIEVLDLSNNTELFTGATFESIPRYNTLTKLLLANCGLKDLSKVSYIARLETLDVSNNTIDDFRPLLACAKLKSVHLYGNGDKNYFTTTYVLLTNRNVEVIALAPIEGNAPVAFITNANLDEAAGVLEAISIFGESVIGGTVVLPYSIKKPTTGSYTIYWTYYDNIGVIVPPTTSITDGLMTVLHGRTASFSLIASVTVGDVTLYRKIEVKI